MFSTVFSLLSQICSITKGVLLVYCVMTWFVSPYSRVMRLLGEVFEPMLMPIRRTLMRISGASRLDFSPYILMLLLQLAQSFFYRLAWMM